MDSPVLTAPSWLVSSAQLCWRDQEELHVFRECLSVTDQPVLWCWQVFPSPLWCPTWLTLIKSQVQKRICWKTLNNSRDSVEIHNGCGSQFRSSGGFFFQQQLFERRLEASTEDGSICLLLKLLWAFIRSQRRFQCSSSKWCQQTLTVWLYEWETRCCLMDRRNHTELPLLWENCWAPLPSVDVWQRTWNWETCYSTPSHLIFP